MPAPDYGPEIASLEAALSAGELKVESDGDLIWYKSAADIMAQITYFRTKAAASAGTLTRGSSVAVFGKD